MGCGGGGANDGCAINWGPTTCETRGRGATGSGFICGSAGDSTGSGGSRRFGNGRVVAVDIICAEACLGAGINFVFWPWPCI
jgi:hypothetical protein